MSDTLIWASEADLQDKLAPSTEKAAKGWVEMEVPPHQWFNWYMNRTDTRLATMETPTTSYMRRWSSGGRTETILAHQRFNLPVSYIVGGNHLRVFLDGVLCEPGEGNQYIECGVPGSESDYIRWNDDIDPTYDIRIEVPVRYTEPIHYADETLVATVQSLADRIAALEEPTFCRKFDSPANTRSDVVRANTAYDVGAEYLVGSDQLQVYVNGILQYENADYKELGVAGDVASDIKFLRDIPISDNIRVYISMRNGEHYTVLSEETTLEAMHKYVQEHKYRENRMDVTTTAVIAARAEYAVPEYIVGNNSIKVFKNGILMVKDRDYAEDEDEGTKSTNIFWLEDVQPGTIITAIVPFFE